MTPSTDRPDLDLRPAADTDVAGLLEYAAAIPGGALPVPTRRYEKRLARDD